MFEDGIRATHRKIFTGRVIFLMYVAAYSCALFVPLTMVFLGTAGAAGLVSILGSLALWTSLLFCVIYLNADIVSRAAGAVPLEKGRFPRLAGAAEDLAIAAGREVPQLMLIEDRAVNAFSMTSVRLRRDVVFCTEGMARGLHPDEMRAVMAHEMAHLDNGDAEIGSLIMPFDAVNSFAYRPGLKISAGFPSVLRFVLTILAVILLIPLLLVLLGYLLWSVVSSDTFAVVVIGLVVPFMAFYLLGIMISLYWDFTLGKRELRADETAIEWTNYPEGMISALIKAGQRDAGSSCAFLDNAFFAPPVRGTRGLIDLQPTIATRIDNIRRETHLPPA